MSTAAIDSQKYEIVPLLISIKCKRVLFHNVILLLTGKLCTNMFVAKLNNNYNLNDINNIILKYYERGCL